MGWLRANPTKAVGYIVTGICFPIIAGLIIWWLTSEEDPKKVPDVLVKESSLSPVEDGGEAQLLIEGHYVDFEVEVYNQGTATADSLQQI
jgi:hypothetical protein